GTAPTAEMMAHCDTLLMVGTSFPYSEFLPEEGQACAVQIDIDPHNLGLRYPTTLNLVGDSKATLAALLPRLVRKNRRWRERLEESVRDWWSLLHARAMVECERINPQLVFEELSRRLPEGAVLTGDAGSSTMWLARHVKVRAGMMASLSGTLASMGSAVPYAIAAKFAFGGRPVVAVAGDGAMQMNGINELITVSKYWREWATPNFVVLVLNNRELNMVTWEMRALSGNPKFAPSQDIPDFPYAEYARALGLGGTRVNTPEGVGPALDAAFSADRPHLVEAITDVNVPMLPPQISFEQAESFFAALSKGDEDAAAIVRQSVREMLAKTQTDGD
ncbi:MAG: thiamine pyrophosphate-requiring protein, partial [Candidatus Eremiobacteraeota bacterium]|nr:thiamine pyrophosphate-requiring protein [Candidatus Eremiobacteraeota bacterium]